MSNNTRKGPWDSLNAIESDVDELSRFYNGAFLESFDALVTSDGAIVTMSLEQSGGGDLNLTFSSGTTLLDCTPAKTIALTAGSDSSPTENFIYILESDPGTLVKSTSDWPNTEHVKIAYFFVPSATYVASNGVYVNQNWNDHKYGTTGQGHLTHMAETIRLTMDGAHWHSGVVGNGATDGYITIVTADTPDSVYFKSTSGTVFQMHRHTVPAIDTSGSDIIHVPNSSVAPYNSIQDIADEVSDSQSISLSGKYYNVVFWGVVNKTGEYSPIMMNLPTGSYSNQSNAVNDVDGHDVYDIPRQFKQESTVGFLICRITLQNTTGGGGGTTVINTTDLRGRTPGTASGTTVGGETTFSDNQFEIFNVSDITRILEFDLSGITTGNTRIVTPADANMIIPTGTLAGATELNYAGVNQVQTTADGIQASIDPFYIRTALGQKGVKVSNNAEIALYYNDLVAFSTDGEGINVADVSGTIASIKFRDSTNNLLGKIQNSAGTFTLGLGASLETGIVATLNGSVALHHDDVKAIETSALGIVLGNTNTSTMQQNGAILQILNNVTTSVMQIYLKDSTGNSEVVANLSTDGGHDWYVKESLGLKMIQTGIWIMGGSQTLYTTITQTGANFMIDNDEPAGTITFKGRTTGDSTVTLAVFNPDGAAESYFAGAKKIETTANGILLEGSLQFDPTPAADLTANGIRITVTVDSNATGVGALLYLAADGNYDEADADAAATMPATAMALESGTGTKDVLLLGFIRKDAWAWTVGAMLYSDTTTGAITETPPAGGGDQVQRIGYAYTADIIYFKPSLTVIEV